MYAHMCSFMITFSFSFKNICKNTNKVPMLSWYCTCMHTLQNRCNMHCRWPPFSCECTPTHHVDHHVQHMMVCILLSRNSILITERSDGTKFPSEILKQSRKKLFLLCSQTVVAGVREFYPCYPPVCVDNQISSCMAI